MDADYVEEVGSNDDLRGELRIVGSSQSGELEDVPGEALEGVAAGSVIAEIGKGEGSGVRALDGFDGDETRGIGVRQRAEDNLLDDGEHGGVDADAEAEGDDGGEGKGGGFSELSQGETKVLGQRGHARISWVWISNCSAADGERGSGEVAEFSLVVGAEGGGGCSEVEGGVRKWAVTEEGRVRLLLLSALSAVCSLQSASDDHRDLPGGIPGPPREIVCRWRVRGSFSVGNPDVFHLRGVLQEPATFGLCGIEPVVLVAVVGRIPASCCRWRRRAPSRLPHCCGSTRSRRRHRVRPRSCPVRRACLRRG